MYLTFKYLTYVLLPYWYYYVMISSFKNCNLIYNITFYLRSASLPITFKVLDEKLKMNPKITKFVLPIGTINMDGSALYLSVALLFLAQINNLQLGIGDIFTIGYAIKGFYDIYNTALYNTYRITRYSILTILFFAFFYKQFNNIMYKRHCLIVNTDTLQIIIF